MKIIEVEQGSPEWHMARCGIPTASNFDKIVDIQGDPTKQKRKYLFSLAGERVTGRPEDGFVSAAMLRGKEMEAEAVDFYEITTGRAVQRVGFCLAEGYGCSPDGLIGEDGGLEIKCPTLATHVSYLVDGKMPWDYFQQVQGSLLVTGRKWWDFMSYYPGMKPLLVRVEPNKLFQNKLRVELEMFCAEIDEVYAKIK